LTVDASSTLAAPTRVDQAHNRHHAHPNQVGRDPDIASRAIAFTADQARSRPRMGAWVARHQAWLFFPMLLLEGLNYQIEHHLFPSMPRPSLRRAQATVRAFCAHHGVSYCETGLLASYAQVLRHLHTAGRPGTRTPAKPSAGPDRSRSDANAARTATRIRDARGSRVGA
jgi:fatty acid desaturase